jgi:hypothetical protein
MSRKLKAASCTYLGAVKGRYPLMVAEIATPARRSFDKACDRRPDTIDQRCSSSQRLGAAKLILLVVIIAVNRVGCAQDPLPLTR